VETARLRVSQGKSNLEDSIALLPTPTARDGSGRGFPGPDYVTRTGRPLDEVIHMLPTPTAADATGTRMARSGTRSDELLLNGIARAVSTGASTPLPSDGGTGSSGELHLFPASPDPEVA